MVQSLIEVKLPIVTDNQFTSYRESRLHGLRQVNTLLYQQLQKNNDRIKEQQLLKPLNDKILTRRKNFTVVRKRIHPLFPVTIRLSNNWLKQAFLTTRYILVTRLEKEQKLFFRKITYPVGTDKYTKVKQLLLQDITTNQVPLLTDFMVANCNRLLTRIEQLKEYKQASIKITANIKKTSTNTNSKKTKIKAIRKNNNKEQRMKEHKEQKEHIVKINTFHWGEGKADKLINMIICCEPGNYEHDCPLVEEELVFKPIVIEKIKLWRDIVAERLLTLISTKDYTTLVETSVNRYSTSFVPTLTISQLVRGKHPTIIQNTTRENYTPSNGGSWDFDKYLRDYLLQRLYNMLQKHLVGHCLKHLYNFATKEKDNNIEREPFFNNLLVTPHERYLKNYITKHKRKPKSYPKSIPLKITKNGEKDKNKNRDQQTYWTEEKITETQATIGDLGKRVTKLIKQAEKEIKKQQKLQKQAIKTNKVKKTKEESDKVYIEKDLAKQITDLKTGITLLKSINREMTASVIHTYDVATSYPGETIQQQRKQRQLANKKIAELQKELYDKMTPSAVTAAITLVREQPKLQGISGTATLAENIGDRSNLGQSAFLTLLNAAKGVINKENKLQWFLEKLSEEKNHQLALEWFIFGRSPYMEQQFSKYYHYHYDYARNLIMGARRTVDKHLPEHEQLLSPLPPVTAKEIELAFETFYNDKIKIFKEFDEKATLSKRQKQFLKKLDILYPFKDLLASFLHEHLFALVPHDEKTTIAQSRSKSRWKQLKQASKIIYDSLQEIGKDVPYSKSKLSFFSILRGVVVTALAPRYNFGATVIELIDNGVLVPEKMVAQPFKKNKKSEKYTKEKKNNSNSKKYKEKLPISLIMGSKYVIKRPGNKTVLTKLAKEKGEFIIEVPLVSRSGRRKRVDIPITVRFHRKIREYLVKGATIDILVLQAGEAPAHKPRIRVIMSGKRWQFFSQQQIEDYQHLFKNTHVPTTKGIAFDINRLGKFILAFSDTINLPQQLLIMCDRYKALDKTMTSLQRKLQRMEDHQQNLITLNVTKKYSTLHRRYLKIQGEITRIHHRKKRLLKVIHQQCELLTTSVLYQGKYSFLGIEELSVSARNTKGALAKAILTMPDEKQLYTRAVIRATIMTGDPIPVIPINPFGTSQSKHHGCKATTPGHLCRSSGQYDEVICRTCGKLVNTHDNAAQDILSKATTLYHRYFPYIKTDKKTIITH